MARKTRITALCGSLAFAGTLLALTACGDDVTKVTNVTNEVSGMEVVSSADSLGKCDSSTLGKTAYASDENVAYVCADSGWAPLSKNAGGKDGASCLAETLSDSSGYKIVCGGDSVGVIANGQNGSDGKTGEKGDAGENGSACTVEALSSGTGYKVVCDGDSVGVIVNGVDGNDCTLEDNGDGTVTQVCGENSITLYKAFCGGTVYDPAKAYCFNEVLYSCGEKPHDPAAYKCIENKLVAFFVDARDSQEYLTVTIGEQTWMAENLNFEYNEGTAQSYCYSDDPANCEMYGRLYTWSAAMDSAAVFSEDGKDCGYGKRCSASGTVRGVCPEGWHLPSYEEWKTLDAYVADKASDGVGYALKSTSGWNNDGNGSDEFGFEALPAGSRHGVGNFLDVFNTAYFWSSTEEDVNIAYARFLNYSITILQGYYTYKNAAYSVRCVKD